MKFVLALDQGTTSSRAIIFDHGGNVAATSQKEFRQIFPQAGWVEHNPNEIWESQLAVAKQAIAEAKIDANQIAGIGITNQRETTIVWDRTTGEPIYNAIVWQDRRTAEFCDGLKNQGHLESIQRKTGLVIDAYFSASKLRWILDHVPGAREKAAKGELAFGTVDSWLLWKLTGVHATDVSNASRTMLCNIQTVDWDDELLSLFKIPRSVLPAIQNSSGVFGETSKEIFGTSIPIAGIAGDQQAALFGQTCFDRGLAKCTYGTGCFMLMNVGSQPVVSQHKLLTTVGWRIGEEVVYALEGSVFVGGAIVQWLRDGLGLIKTAAEIQTLAEQVPDSGGVYFVPAFAGLGAPHWDQYARGTIAGMTRGTTSAHLARAALESIAFQVADVLDVMKSDSRLPIPQLRVDGGAAVNDLLMQMQADILRLPIVRPKVTETTALGVAYLAGLAVKLWGGIETVRSNWKIDRTFEPRMTESETIHRRGRWAEALERSRDWEQHSRG